MIKIETIFALNDEELQERLNTIEGRIISVENFNEYRYKVIYETSNGK